MRFLILGSGPDADLAGGFHVSEFSEATIARRIVSECMVREKPQDSEASALRYADNSKM